MHTRPQLVRLANTRQDEQRLPEGFVRTGYDADEQIYYFSDGQGRTYESEPGNRYGTLWPTGQRPRPQRSPAEVEAHNAELKKSNRESVKMMLPFALLVLVFLLLLFRFLNGGSADDPAPQIHCVEGAHPIQIKKGDTCYEIGKAHGVGVDELLQIGGNEGVDCDHLKIGHMLCVPV